MRRLGRVDHEGGWAVDVWPWDLTYHEREVTEGVAVMTVAQKLLGPDESRAIGRQGASGIGGPVVLTGDAGPLRTPQDMLAAYGLEEWAPYGEDPAFVDVLRFEATPLTQLSRPDPAPGAVPWLTYASGFLSSTQEIIPVWWLTYTRVPTGAEIWRIHATGDQQILAAGDGKI